LLDTHQNVDYGLLLDFRLRRSTLELSRVFLAHLLHKLHDHLVSVFFVLFKVYFDFLLQFKELIPGVLKRHLHLDCRSLALLGATVLARSDINEAIVQHAGELLHLFPDFVNFFLCVISDISHTLLQQNNLVCHFTILIDELPINHLGDLLLETVV